MVAEPELELLLAAAGCSRDRSQERTGAGKLVSGPSENIFVVLVLLLLAPLLIWRSSL